MRSPARNWTTRKASGVASIFTYGSFADVLAPRRSGGGDRLDKPSTVQIETFDNFSYELRIGKLTGENYPVLVSVKARAAEGANRRCRRKTGRQSQSSTRNFKQSKSNSPTSSPRNKNFPPVPI